MCLKCVTSLLCLSIFINTVSLAQQTDSTIVFADSTLFYKDSVIVYSDLSLQKPDTTQLYQNIQNYLNRSKFTKALHRLLFKREYSINDKNKTYEKLIQKSYSRFQGKIIRDIYIETLDPFGYSISDRTVKPDNFFLNAGNALHVKSQSLTIRNLLLISKNQVFDSVRVKESERLVHSRNFIYDVAFDVRFAPKSTDSVDVFIRVIDNWSIVPKLENSSSRLIFNLKDKNLGGLGHTFQNDLTWLHHSGKVYFDFDYYVPNIRNTYISSTLHYGTDALGHFSKSVALDRPFFSPFAKWAAGIEVAKRNNYKVDLGIDQPVHYFNTQDYWAGKAIEVRHVNPANRHSTNVIYAARYFKIHYLKNADFMFDTLQLFANERNYLASLGVSTRKYVQDRYIFKFGMVEDVPIGRVLNFIGGYQVMDDRERWYLGMRVSSGYYYTWGYLSLNLEGGTYFRSSFREQGVVTASANYTSGLFEIGNWRLRQFVKPQITLGFNPWPTDSLTINEGYGLKGFRSTTLSGTSRLLLAFQTQTYSPWNVIGFRFGPYFLCSLGMVGNTANGFRKSKVYSQFGVGVLIKNEHLVFNAFQLSLAFYPMIPGDKNNVFKVNSFRSADYGFSDFVIGKPSTLVLQ